jgi:hypothetical protein
MQGSGNSHKFNMKTAQFQSCYHPWHSNASDHNRSEPFSSDCPPEQYICQYIQIGVPPGRVSGPDVWARRVVVGP